MSTLGRLVMIFVPQGQHWQHFGGNIEGKVERCATAFVSLHCYEALELDLNGNVCSTECMQKKSHTLSESQHVTCVKGSAHRVNRHDFHPPSVFYLLSADRYSVRDLSIQTSQRLMGQFHCGLAKQSRNKFGCVQCLQHCS